MLSPRERGRSGGRGRGDAMGRGGGRRVVTGSGVETPVERTVVIAGTTKLGPMLDPGSSRASGTFAATEEGGASPVSSAPSTILRRSVSRATVAFAGTT